MRRAAIVFAASLLAALACARSGAGDDAGALEAAAPADTLPHRFIRTLDGTVGDDAVVAWLRREDDRLSGTWTVGDAEHGLAGTVGAAGSVAAALVSAEGDTVATLEGTLAEGPEGLTLAGSYRAPGAEPRAVALAEKQTLLEPGIRLVPRTWVDEDAERGWSIHAEVPAAAGDGGALPPAYRAFNEAVDSLVQADAAPFRTMVLEHEPVPGVAGGSTYESSYEVMLAEEGIASLAFDVFVYLAGAAHPNHYSWTLTWDLDAGRPVALGELFLSGAPYLQTLSDYSVPVLQQELAPAADDAWIAEGAGPIAENYARWTLTPEGLRIVFDAYQVAPYAAGPREVLVRWSALEPILDPAGPAARIAR